MNNWIIFLTLILKSIITMPNPIDDMMFDEPDGTTDSISKFLRFIPDQATGECEDIEKMSVKLESCLRLLREYCAINKDELSTEMIAAKMVEIALSCEFNNRDAEKKMNAVKGMEEKENITKSKFSKFPVILVLIFICIIVLFVAIKIYWNRRKWKQREGRAMFMMMNSEL